MLHAIQSIQCQCIMKRCPIFFRIWKNLSNSKNSTSRVYYSTETSLPKIDVIDFDFNHRYKPFHPRISDDTGELIVQGTRYQFFWASFDAALFELNYRVHKWPVLRNKQIVYQRWSMYDGIISYNTGNCGQIIQYNPQSGLLHELKLPKIKYSNPIHCFTVSNDLIALTLRNKPNRILLFTTDGQDFVGEYDKNICTDIHRLFIARMENGSLLVSAHDRDDIVLASLTVDLINNAMVPVSTELVNNHSIHCSYMNPECSFSMSTNNNQIKLFQHKAEPNQLFNALNEKSIWESASKVKIERTALVPPRKSNEFPFLIYTYSSYTSGISSYYLHCTDPNPEPAISPMQIFGWSPNEGSITEIGSTADGSKLLAVIHCGVPREPNVPDLIFEFPYSTKRKLNPEEAGQKTSTRFYRT